MKKTLIAASIAALAATSANAAVKLYESETGSFSSYGKIQLELENYDGENTIQNQGSRLGFSGDTQLDNGLTAFTNFEFRFQPGVQNNVAKKDEGEWTVRNSYLGVKGDFGSVKAGNFDSIVYTMVTEQADIFENRGYRSLDEGENNSRGTAIAYETNDISGFKFGLGIKHYASKKSQYKDLKKEGLASEDGKEQWNLQLGATYQLNDEVKFGLAIDQNNKKGDPQFGKNGTTKTKPIIAASALYETELFSTGLVVENNEKLMIANLTGSVNYGAGDVYALVSFADDGNKGGKSGIDFGLGANYKMSNNFKVYGEVAVGNKKQSEIQKPVYNTSGRVPDGEGDFDYQNKAATVVTLGAAYKW